MVITSAVSILETKIQPHNPYTMCYNCGKMPRKIARLVSEDSACAGSYCSDCLREIVSELEK